MKKASSLKVSAGYWYGLEDGQELTIQSTRGSYKKHFDCDEEPPVKSEQVEATEEKLPLPTPEGEYIEDLGDFKEIPNSLKTSEEGEYVEEPDDDEKPSTLTKENKEVEINSIYDNELYRDIENLSVNDEPAEEDSTDSDGRKTCNNCQVGFRDLDKHKRIQHCQMLPFPQMRSSRRSRE